MKTKRLSKLSNLYKYLCLDTQDKLHVDPGILLNHSLLEEKRGHKQLPCTLNTTPGQLLIPIHLIKYPMLYEITVGMNIMNSSKAGSGFQ
jgi:hypothetical protein